MFLAFLVHIISMVISFHINVIENKIRKIGLWSKMNNPSFDKRVIHCKTQMLRPTDLYNSLFEQSNLIWQEQGPTKTAVCIRVFQEPILTLTWDFPGLGTLGVCPSYSSSSPPSSHLHIMGP